MRWAGHVARMGEERKVYRVLVGKPWWWRQYAPLKRRSTIILHGNISQKTILNIIFAAVRTWNLTHFSYTII
jgi:hypothetical protein